MIFILVKTSSDILFCDYSHKYILFISVLCSLDIHLTVNIESIQTFERNSQSVTCQQNDARLAGAQRLSVM